MKISKPSEEITSIPISKFDQSNLRVTAPKQANYEEALAKIEKMSNRYYKGEEVSFNPPLEYFEMYGPGIYLFFHFIRIMAIFLTICSAVSLLPICYNYIKGTAFSNSADSLQTYFSRTSIGNLATSSGVSTLDTAQSEAMKMFNSIPDMINCVLFVVFYMIWSIYSNTLTEKVKKKIKLQSYSTIELIEFPAEANEVEIEQFFARYGPVKQVAPVQECDEVISLSKQLHEAQTNRQSLVLEGADAEEIKSVAATVEQLKVELQKCISLSSTRIMKYFITFEKIETRQEVLARFKKLEQSWWCFSKNVVPQEDKLCGSEIRIVPCHNQPGDIIWQNIHITWRSRILRIALQFVLLLLIIAFAFLFISLLSIIVPASNSTIDTSSFTSTTILSQPNPLIIQDWCVKNTDKVSASATLTTFCGSYINNYYLKTAIGMAISLVVLVFKTFLRVIVVYLSKFQRYTNHTEQSIDIMENLFYNYLCTTVLITFLLQANILGISFKEIVKIFLHNDYLRGNVSSQPEYFDFVPFWYVDIGYKIFFTWAIMAVQEPLLGPLINYFSTFLRHCKAQSEKVQDVMEQSLMPSQFEIEDHYANILLIMFVGLIFSGGMPLILIPCCVALITRYFYLKFLFIRFCRVPKTLDEALNQRILGYMPFMILGHCAFTLWMYSSNSIFTDHIGDWNIGGILGKFGQVFSRLFNTWYYLIFCGVILGFFIGKTIIYNFLYEILKEKRSDDKVPTMVLKGEKAVLQLENDSGFTLHKDQIQQDPAEACITQIRSERTLSKGYRIEQNPDYFEILAVMKLYRSKNKIREVPPAKCEVIFVVDIQ